MISTKYPITQSSFQLRKLVAEGLLAGGFLVSCFFYGVGFNLSFLWLVVLVPVALWWTAGTERISSAISQQPGTMFSCLAILGCILVNHSFFSISVDTSFAPSWIAAVLPLFAIACLLCSGARVFQIMAWIVFLFATVSCVEYIVYEQRAHAPFFEPNNYVTFLYLAWLPWMLMRVAQENLSWQVALTVVVSFVVCMAMFATHSRFGIAVGVGSCLLLGFLCWRKDFGRYHTVFTMAGVVAALFAYTVMQADGFGESAVAGNPGVVAEPNHRWLMIESAFHAAESFGSFGGIGLFNYASLYPMFRSPFEQETTGQFVHNDYVQLALEGGVWLILPLLFFVVLVAYRCLRGLLSSEPWDPRLAFLLAIGVAMVHAMVNFVFYILPLCILIGVAAANGFARADNVMSVAAASVRGWVVKGLWWLVGLVLLLNSAWLAVDVMLYGVFSNRSYLPFVSQIRSSNESMLVFARTVQKLNPDRGLPVLGEARIMDALLPPDADSPLTSDVNDAYLRAIAADPWNSQVFTDYYEFLLRYPRYKHASPTADPARLLRLAETLAPRDLRGFALRVDRYISNGDITGARREVSKLLEWCEITHRKQADALENLFERLSSSQFMQADEGLLDKVNACRTSVGKIDQDGRQPTVLMRWLKNSRAGDATIQSKE